MQVTFCDPLLPDNDWCLPGTLTDQNAYCSCSPLFHPGPIFLPEIPSREGTELGNYHGSVSFPQAYLLDAEIIPGFLLCL